MTLRDTHLFTAAPVHRGLQHIDPSLFTRTIDLHAVQVPAQKSGPYRELLGNHLLKQRKLQNIALHPDNHTQRLLLLDHLQTSALPDDLQQLIAQTEDLQLSQYTLQLGYDYWTADQILKAVLPEAMCDDSPSSFTQVGHIAHLNLRDEYLPYKTMIGRVILDKNTGIKTVVNKLDTIDTEFRFFKMEVLAGEPNYEVELSEQGCKFRFDFSKVYWNSRLSTEHARLVNTFKPNEVVVDGFAGVGPFAIPAAKKGCAVWSNDLNPESAKALDVNIKLNKIVGQIRNSNEDARVFFRKAVLDIWRNPIPVWSESPSARAIKEAKRAGKILANQSLSNTTPSRIAQHFVMNLPASAIEFLDVFKGIYRPILEEDGFRELWDVSKKPLVHCYCFTKEVDDFENDIQRRATAALGFSVNSSLQDYSLSFVRAVAPNKDMYRLSFRLNDEIAFA